MAKTITVAPGPALAAGQVAIWEVNTEHPDGEVYLAAPHVGEDAPAAEVARTPEVSKRLSDGRLVEAEARRVAAPAPTAPAAPAESAPASRPAAGGIPDSTMQALAVAGYDTPEKVRAASDDDLKRVPGVGDAMLARIREATKE